MKQFTFDMTLKASFTIAAETREDAERILNERLDCATIQIVHDNDELRGEASIDDTPALAQIDGKDV